MLILTVVLCFPFLYIVNTVEYCVETITEDCGGRGGEQESSIAPGVLRIFLVTLQLSGLLVLSDVLVSFRRELSWNRLGWWRGRFVSPACVIKSMGQSRPEWISSLVT